MDSALRLHAELSPMGSGNSELLKRFKENGKLCFDSEIPEEVNSFPVLRRKCSLSA